MNYQYKRARHASLTFSNFFPIVICLEVAELYVEAVTHSTTKL